MKTIVTVQDLSCYGKCALMNAVPVLDVMGLSASVLPTALLSAHTGFPRVHARDLTEDMDLILDRWEADGIRFDSALCGYLASPAQAAAVERLFRDFTRGLKILDPAMGDNGRLYRGVDRGMADAVRRLAGTSDVIIPNLTEAAELTGTAYCEAPGRDMLRELLRALTALGPAAAVITGIPGEGGTIGAAGLFKGAPEDRGTYCEAFSPRYPLSWHGTGDLFAACLAGALVRGQSPEEAVSLSVRFVAEAIRVSPSDPSLERHGVHFEKVLSMLLPR